MNRTLAVFVGLAAIFAIGIGIGRLAVSEPNSPVQNKHLVYVLEQIRHARFADQDIGVLSLAEFGMGARPDPSYLLFRYVAAVASPPTLMEILTHPFPTTP